MASIFILAIASFVGYQVWAEFPPTETFTEDGDTLERVKNLEELTERLNVHIHPDALLGNERYYILNEDTAQIVFRWAGRGALYLLRVRKQEEPATLIADVKNATLDGERQNYSYDAAAYEADPTIEPKTAETYRRYLPANEDWLLTLVEDWYVYETQTQYSICAYYWGSDEPDAVGILEDCIEEID